TLERGSELLERLVAEAKDSGTSWIDAADAFKLHDTYGFPYDLTKELLAEAEAIDGNFLVKLDESPFYAEGGGQVADSGVLRAAGAEIAVKDVYRLGEDQALLLEADPGEVAQIEAEVDAEARHATMRNHTATHLLHAALRERLGTHVRQAGSAVRPDKLRFDFTHGAPLTGDEVRDVG